MSADQPGATLWIDDGCIETAARGAYRKLSAQILGDDPVDPKLEDDLELLRELLAQEDFAAIRASDPELCGGSGCGVRVFRDTTAAVRWEKLP